MSYRRQIALVAWTVAVSITLVSLPASVLGQGQQVHGENSSFLGNGVAMVWVVLRGTSEEDTQVILHIAPAGSEFAAVSVDGVDPFTQQRREILAKRPLGDGLDVRTSRATFADFPRREIHFYAGGGQHAHGPSLTVYFMGLPDTSPEFNSETALKKYVDDTLTKLLAAKGRTP
ncbi:MAG: hypothetical protein H6Q29_1318 [Bacteroidetes bacterium]|nr:hypothetical protein [Bacteroidota bacterium]